MSYIKRHIARATQKIINNIEIIEKHSLHYGIEKAANYIAENIFKSW